MRFNFTLISAFFFASAVLADRSPEHRSSQLNIVEKRTNATSGSDSEPIGYTEWAGAGLIWSVPTFWAISGTFIVPNISGPTGSAVGIWVAIDNGYGSPCGALFQAGVMGNMTSSGPVYKAMAEWRPDSEAGFTEIGVSPGDLITVSLNVTSDQTTGNATLENFGNGTEQMTYETVEFIEQSHALCDLDAEWMVSRVGNSTLANFDVVSFRHPLAHSTDQEFTPAVSVISEIEDKTAVYADEDSVTIWYYELVT